ncbi:MAG: alpha/beta hydrolase fold domain-containing protein [Candidatus Lokiarchaeota archaeon]|nr:alpha/beta hydrolase fold domain-containing protein [Candidatus Lokiarchaeota archaeon]
MVVNMRIKIVLKYLILIFGYFMLIIGLLLSLIILTGGNLLLALFNMFLPELVGFFILLIGVILIVMIKLHDRKRHKYWLIPLFFGLIVIIFFSLPIFGTPYSVYNTEAQLKSEFGSNYMDGISADMRSNFRITPFSLWAAINGYQAPECNVSIDHDFYATRKSDKYYFDLYTPLQGTGPYPAIIVLHGGGWVTGDKSQLTLINKYLANQGYAIFDIQYGLSKISAMNLSIPFDISNLNLGSSKYNESIRIPEMVENIGNFTHFLVSNKEKYNIDINNTFVLGRSAGAHLAGLVGLGYNSTFNHLFNTSIKIRGVVLFYPPANMTHMFEFIGNDRLIKQTAGSHEAFFEYLLNATPSSNKTVYEIYSPTHNIDSNSPPVLIIHGTHDKLVSYSMSVELQKEMHSFNRPCILVSFPFHGHGLDSIFTGKGGQISTYYLERFFAFTLNNNV